MDDRHDNTAEGQGIPVVDPHDVRSGKRGQMACLSSVNDHLGVYPLEQLRDSLDLKIEQLATHMIGMGVGDQDVGESHLIDLGELYDPVDLPGRIDHSGLFRPGRADQIDVVGHLAQFYLLQIESVTHLILHGCLLNRSTPIHYYDLTGDEIRALHEEEDGLGDIGRVTRSEEHTSELQSPL